MVLKNRLARRFGSADFASDVLQDTYLNLNKDGAAEAVRHPESYLYRVALNVARDHQRGEKRRIAAVAVEELLRRDDYEIDPHRIFEARAEVERLGRVLDELPPRRRGILIASRYEGLSHRDIASRFGISQDTVNRELKLALELLDKRLDKKSRPRRGPGSKPSSPEQE
jgi:RNA polymerase sigma-70 factor (ECF subfamily)